MPNTPVEWYVDRNAVGLEDLTKIWAYADRLIPRVDFIRGELPTSSVYKHKLSVGFHS
ncbi:hypothetical protein JR316_0010301 [Psilocybe cubensis]|uniref:Uncharacterized protein n=1 Tax=Psilocybe cubensis TaxID=181762 RepID=A0ACB8GRH9_PSICU|nr:hypothetical protein JR316_0010301 [Psilocybe cubensis]KAH9478064.1 hypothetical protein JR316_0010301 [Psilocybe cubensis]